MGIIAARLAEASTEVLSSIPTLDNVKDTDPGVIKTYLEGLVPNLFDFALQMIIAIVVYIIVLHLRLIKPLNNPFVFSVASLVAFSSILMTYFGVNFYLSGLHSYATGDPVPIPTWVYVSVITIGALIALAYKNRNLKTTVGE